MTDRVPHADDPLGTLRERLTGLDEADLDDFPDVLERVHLGLVGELDGLRGAGSPPAASG